jgi:hypothetical protein
MENRRNILLFKKRSYGNVDLRGYFKRNTAFGGNFPRDRDGLAGYTLSQAGPLGIDRIVRGFEQYNNYFTV